MSYNDSRGQRRQSSRRGAREPAGPSKIQGSTAAAILVFVGIVGFGVGAVVANLGGGDGRGATASEDPDAPGSSPDDQSDNPGDEPTENGDNSQEPSATEITLEMADSAPAGEELEYTVQTEPPQPGLVLGVERRLPEQDWEPFGSEEQLTVELDDDGERDGHVITGITGQSEWRFVGEIDGQRVISNVVTAEITEEDDNSGPGNGDDD